MKNIFFVLAFLVVAISTKAQLCCNVIDGSGLNVITANGICVITSKGSDGCIEDSDGDGVADADDKCPSEAGLASNSGCPVLTDDDKAILSAALEGVKFKSDSDELLPESNEKLDNVVILMKKHPDFKLRISGYTDNTGDKDYNLSLSDKRAHAAESYIIGKGIKSSRITAKGYGVANPIADNSTAEGRAKNRRVEFELIVD